MALSDHAKRAYQIKYIRAYLAPRNYDNTYDAWINVTRYVDSSNIGQSSKSIDSDDFSIGFYEESNVRIAFDNLEAKFTDGRGFFEGKVVDQSKVKIVAGYISVNAPDDASAAEFETTFEGVIDERATALDTDRESAQFQILAYSSIIRRLQADPGAVTNGQTFQVALFNLLNRTEINQLLTVDLDNINPQVNETVDVATWFSGKQLTDAVNRLLYASNSVMRVTNNTIYISGRVESSTVRFQFFGKGSNKPANIYSLKNFNSGTKRVITRLTINGTTIEASSDLISRYGSQAKTIDLGFLTDTTKVGIVGADIIDEFAYPKQEMELTTDFLGNEIDILDMVTIDNEGNLVDPNPPVYGRAVYGIDSYTRRQGGIRIRNIEGFKVLGITHDYRQYTTTYKLRSVGNQPYDSNAGYSNPIYGQAIYGLSKYARLDVGGGGGGSGGSGGGSLPPESSGSSGSPIGLFLTITNP